MSEILKRIKGKSNWEVKIRPLKFEQQKIPDLKQCLNIVESSRVSLRGWDYPYIDRSNINYKKEYISSEIDGDTHVEVWRMYQSGQFYHVFRFQEDFLIKEAKEIASNIMMPQGFSPSGYFAVTSALFKITEIFEFASRIAKNFNEKYLEIVIKLSGLQNRVLIEWDPRKVWVHFYKCSEPVLEKRIPLELSELIKNSRKYSVDVSLWFFEKFGWLHANRKFLENDQEKLIKKRL